MATISNFRLVSIIENPPPQLIEFDVIEGYNIYHSQFNTAIYVLYDHEFNVYRNLEFEGANVFDVTKAMKSYIENYYSKLSGEDKSTLTYKINKGYLD